MFKIQIWQFIEYRFVDSSKFGTFNDEAKAWKRVLREVRSENKDISRFKVVPCEAA